jgi:hypothetical protein
MEQYLLLECDAMQSGRHLVSEESIVPTFHTEDKGNIPVECASEACLAPVFTFRSY